MIEISSDRAHLLGSSRKRTEAERARQTSSCSSPARRKIKRKIDFSFNSNFNINNYLQVGLVSLAATLLGLSSVFQLCLANGPRTQAMHDDQGE